MSNHGECCDTYTVAEDFGQRLAGLVDFEEHEAEAYAEVSAAFLTALLVCYWTMLGKEYDWQISDKNAEENIILNEYEFTADSKRFVMPMESGVQS